jgi:predicted DNA-binding WGR domain protein
MKRHFKFVRGTSSKFWDVSVANCTVTICFGRIGTSGQSQDKMIAEKLRKGYLETVQV